MFSACLNSFCGSVRDAYWRVPVIHMACDGTFQLTSSHMCCCPAFVIVQCGSCSQASGRSGACLKETWWSVFVSASCGLCSHPEHQPRTWRSRSNAGRMMRLSDRQRHRYRHPVHTESPGVACGSVLTRFHNRAAVVAAKSARPLVRIMCASSMVHEV
jgi:hypothetical protein